MLAALHVYDDLEPKSAALNMAVDEALLTDVSIPILRFYRWERPSISFGYFGHYAEAAAEAGKRELVRRWTGGGIVPHGDDLTYSVIIPASEPLFQKSSSEIYRVLHEAVRRALVMNGIVADLVTAAAPKISEACFANPVRADVLSDGRKIAGAAHRRSRTALLHQGSIQYRDLPGDFRSHLAQTLCPSWEARNLGAETMDLATKIAEIKYGTAAWLHRR